MKFKSLALAIVLGAAIAGCSDNGQTPKEKVTQQWNSARASVMVGLAKQQYEGGDLEKARKSADDALKLDPKNIPLLVLSAKIGIEQGQLELAERQLEQAIEQDPKNAEAEYLSGVIYQRWQKPDVALNRYSNAVEKAPSELPYVMARAEMLVSMNRRPEALSLLQSKMQYFENSGAIRDAVGQLYVQDGKYTEAVDVLRQASILSQDDNTIKEHLGLAMFYAKQYAGACEVLSRLVGNEKYSNRSDLQCALGESQLQLGRNREARASFEQAAQIDPGSAKVWLGLGKAAMQTKDNRRAELSLKKSLSLDPNSSEANLLLGYLKLRENKLNEALTAFSKASAINPQDTTSVCMVGYVYEKLGKPEEAMQHYAKALKLKPNDDLATKLMASVEMK